MTDCYRDIDCPNCNRHRVQANGVCEKCLWDVDNGNYVNITRPDEYDHCGRIVNLPENSLLGSEPTCIEER